MIPKVTPVLITILFLSFAFTPAVQAESASTPSPAEQAAAVREYFSDVPAMIEIAECESGLRQFTNSGSVLYGGAGGKMIGVFQLHGDYHASAAQTLGFDILTLNGNLEYARYLYEIEGLKPWTPCLSAVSDASLLFTPADEQDESQELSKEENQTHETKDDLRARIEFLQKQLALLRIEFLKLKIAQLQRGY